MNNTKLTIPINRVIQIGIIKTIVVNKIRGENITYQFSDNNPIKLPISNNRNIKINPRNILNETLFLGDKNLLYHTNAFKSILIISIIVVFLKKVLLNFLYH